MTHEEYLRLPDAARKTIPAHLGIGWALKTYDDWAETLRIEGWEFVGYDDRFRDEPDYDQLLDRSEVWRREVAGQVEWFELSYHDLPKLDTPPERCWFGFGSTYDPRTIVDG
ncbi:unnamed protein product [Gemmata massiliana]|uniref:Uncharacterized protein n=1 Tax=Gemmata massiliana TaxID=1210884 RepID=A0A6P2CR97_9BACT|nr:hypothetical protein [Gemmata massiliana]VTR91588.1 unnamed protein product [Gemmata massiliana]